MNQSMIILWQKISEKAFSVLIFQFLCFSLKFSIGSIEYK